MNKTLRKVIFWSAVVLCMYLIFTTGFTGFLLISILALVGLGFWAGWQAHADDEVRQWLYNLQPPDDKPPDGGVKV